MGKRSSKVIGALVHQCFRPGLLVTQFLLGVCLEFLYRVFTDLENPEGRAVHVGCHVEAAEEDKLIVIHRDNAVVPSRERSRPIHG